MAKGKGKRRRASKAKKRAASDITRKGKLTEKAKAKPQKTRSQVALAAIQRTGAGVTKGPGGKSKAERSKGEARKKVELHARNPSSESRLLRERDRCRDAADKLAVDVDRFLHGKGDEASLRKSVKQYAATEGWGGPAMSWLRRENPSKPSLKYALVALHRPEAYAILKPLIAPKPASWTRGGCCVFVLALQGYLSRGDLMMLERKGKVVHVVLKLGRKYVDAKGRHTKSELLGQWSAGGSTAHLLDFDARAARKSGVKCPKPTKLLAYLDPETARMKRHARESMKIYEAYGATENPGSSSKDVEDFIIRTNAIEGYKLDRSEVRSALEAVSQGYPISYATQDAHILATLRMIKAAGDIKSINASAVRGLHRAQGRDVLDAGAAGMFRTGDSMSSTGTVYIEGKKIPAAMRKWERTQYSSPFQKVAVLMHIHPFEDGNGRMGRMVLLKLNGMDFKKTIRDVREPYIRNLRKSIAAAQVTQNPSPGPSRSDRVTIFALKAKRGMGKGLTDIDIRNLGVIKRNFEVGLEVSALYKHPEEQQNLRYALKQVNHLLRFERISRSRNPRRVAAGRKAAKRKVSRMRISSDPHIEFASEVKHLLGGRGRAGIWKGAVTEEQFAVAFGVLDALYSAGGEMPWLKLRNLFVTKHILATPFRKLMRFLSKHKLIKVWPKFPPPARDAQKGVVVYLTLSAAGELEPALSGEEFVWRWILEESEESREPLKVPRMYPTGFLPGDGFSFGRGSHGKQAPERAKKSKSKGTDKDVGEFIKRGLKRGKVRPETEDFIQRGAKGTQKDIFAGMRRHMQSEVYNPRKTPQWKLLINRCHKLWTNYCERPSKKRLEVVYDHLDKMKLSSSKKVAAERVRCLRAANAEAKRIKLKR